MSETNNQNLDDMLSMNPKSKESVARVLCDYLPDGVLSELRQKSFIISLSCSDANTISKDRILNRNIVNIAQRMIPAPDSPPSKPEFRYFALSILHEVAHLTLPHVTGLPAEEDREQEIEAWNQAMAWFNASVEEQRERGPEIELEELKDLLNQADDRRHRHLGCSAVGTDFV